MNIADLRRRYQGFSDDEIVEALRATKYQQFSTQEIKDVLGIKPPKRSLFAVANDAVIEAGNAVAGTAGAVANFVDPGNSFSQGVEKFIAEGEASQSDAVKADKARFRQRMDAAQGMGDEVAAVGGYIADAPLMALSQAAGSIAVPAGAIGVAGKTAGAVGVGARGVQATGLAAGAGLGAAGAGGDAAGTAYELAIKAGATEEQAQAAARQASIIPAAVGGLGGVVGAERLLAGARGFGGNVVSRALKTGAVEGVQEGIEEGVTQYEGQRAVVPLDPSIDPMKGVAGAATMGAALGAASGGGIGLLTGGGPEQALRREAADVALADLGQAKTVDEAVAAFTAATDVPLMPDRGGFDDDAEADMRAALAGLDPAERREYLQLAALRDNPKTPRGVYAAATERMAELGRIGTVPAVPSEVREDELLPTADARELTDAERAAYAAGDKTPDQQLREQRLRGASERMRAKLGMPPAVEATELLPTPDVLEVEPIPAGDAFEDIPTPEAAELLPVGDAAEVLPTPEVIEPVDPVPTGEATDIEPEQADTGLLLTGDGQPYGTRSGAYVRAKREGLTPDAVVEVPGGWAVKKEPQGEQPVVDRTAGVPAGAGDARSAADPRGGRTAGPDADGAARVGLPGSPAAPGGSDGAPVAVAPGGGADPALTIKALSKQWAEAVARGDMNEARRLNDAIVEAKKPPAPPAPPAPQAAPAQPEPAAETREQAIRRVWGAAPRKLNEWTPMSVSVGEGNTRRSNDMLAIQRKAGAPITMRVIRMGKLLASDPAEPLMFTFRLTGENKVEQVGRARVPTPEDLAQWEAAGFTVPGKKAEAESENDRFSRLAEAYRAKLKNPERVNDEFLKEKVSELLAMIDAKDADALIRRNLGSAEMNPGSRAMFEAATGVKLPKGRRDTERAIDQWAGVDEDERARRNDSREAAFKLKSARGDVDGARRIAATISVQQPNGEMTPGDKWVDSLFADGFTRIVRRGPKTYLANEAGAGWPLLDKGLSDYARKVVALMELEPDTAPGKRSEAPPDQEPAKQQPVVAPEVPAETPPPAPEPIKNEAPAAPTNPPAPPQQTRPQELIELRKRAAVLKQLLECLG